jgi:hypothetical protein
MFMHPVPGPITSPWGQRKRGFHHGVDYGWLKANAAESRKVYAPASGTVMVGWHDLVGNFIRIFTPTATLRLTHFNTIAVKTGDTVELGRTYLGEMGATGAQVEGVHLHVEVWVDGARVNPAPYFTLAFNISATPDEEEEMQPQNFLDTSTRNAKGEAVNGTVCMTVWPSGAVQLYERRIPTPASEVEFAVQMSRLYGPHRPVGPEVFKSIRDAHLALAVNGGSGGASAEQVADEIAQRMKA